MLQWIGDDQIIISSRETSTILKVDDIYGTPYIDYMIGEEIFWEDSEYEHLILDKVVDFASQTGQHTVTYMEDDSLENSFEVPYSAYASSTQNTDTTTFVNSGSKKLSRI